MTRPVDSDDFSFGGEPIGRRERRPVTIHGQISTEDGSTAEVLVLDLSREGCGIQAPLPLVPGQSIALSVSDRPPVWADVRWWSEGKAGLVFRKAAESAGPSPRAEERVTLKLEASMRRLGLPSYTVTVSDLSPQGCKVDVVERPGVGEHLLLKLPGLDAIDSEVCWVDDYCAGLTFARPIHPAVYDLMVQKLQSRR